MALGMNLFKAFLFLVFHLLLPGGRGQESNIETKMAVTKFLDPHVESEKAKADTKSLSFRRFTQLYSRNSGRHVRINADGSIDAMGAEGDKYAKLVVESVSFGRVSIRGSATNHYLCIDKRGRLRARTRGRWKENCVFTDHLAENAYTEFSSVKYNHSYIAFNRRGKLRPAIKVRSGIKAVQFIERAINIRLYKGRKHRFNRKRGNSKIYLKKSNQPHEKIFIPVKKWREFRRWLKSSKKARTTTAMPLITSSAPRNRTTTTEQLSRNSTSPMETL